MKMVAKMDWIRLYGVSLWLLKGIAACRRRPLAGSGAVFVMASPQVSPLWYRMDFTVPRGDGPAGCTRDSKEAKREEPTEEAMRWMDMDKRMQMPEREGNTGDNDVEQREFKEMLLRCPWKWAASTG